MNTKKALSLILLVSLLSQYNAFGMLKLRLLRTPIFYNTTSSKTVLFSEFSTAKRSTANRSKKQNFRMLQKRKNNAYAKLLTQNRQLRERIKTNERIVSEIKETNNKIGKELDYEIKNNSFFNMVTVFIPFALIRIQVSYLSGLYIQDKVKGSINTHMDDLERKLTENNEPHKLDLSKKNTKKKVNKL